MKKCNDCNTEMIEKTNLHTDYVGGYSYEEQLYVSYTDGTKLVKGIFGGEKEKDNFVTKRVKARVCPKCGKVELFVDDSE